MPNPPKSIAEKLLAGNPGGRKLPQTAPIPGQNAPTMPTFLSSEARKEWRRIVPELEAVRVLAKVDLAVLATYCSAWGRYVEAERQVKKHGLTVTSPSGHVQKSPWLTIADKAVDQLRRLVTELGLSPAARNRVTMNPTADDEGGDFFAVRR